MKSLRIWTGPVASEKTTQALRHTRRLQRRGFKVPAVVRPLRSVRDHEKDEDGLVHGFLVTKAGERFPSVETASIREVEQVCKNWDAVWIDELMLYEDEAEFGFSVVTRILKRIPVLVSTLSATSEMEPFGVTVPKLLAIADAAEFCRADCDGCNTLKTATRSACLLDKNGQVLVGGEEAYRPLCPACWAKWTADPVSFKFAVPAVDGATRPSGRYIGVGSE